jgi:hypothetical protein
MTTTVTNVLISSRPTATARKRGFVKLFPRILSQANSYPEMEQRKADRRAGKY